MKRARIIKMEGIFGRDQTDDFMKFNLNIAVVPFVGNAVYYQPIVKGDVLFIYTWNIEYVDNEL